MGGVKVFIDIVDDELPESERQEILDEASQLVVDRSKISAPYDTGRLVNSISVDDVGDFTATVSASVDYASFLEYGTSRGIQPHNYMSNAARDTERDFQGKIVITVEEE